MESYCLFYCGCACAFRLELLPEKEHILSWKHRIGKQHPFFSNPVDIWRLNQFIVVRTNGLVRMIVAHDKNNIRTLRCTFLLRTRIKK